VTHLLNAEDGPWLLMVRLRRRAGNGFWGELLDCFFCLSLWVAVPFAALLANRWTEGVLLWLALSAGAILLERVTARWQGPPIYFSEDEESSHVLPQAQTTVSGQSEPTLPAGNDGDSRQP
jgi:Protein of unknown function (DUF1360)